MVSIKLYKTDTDRVDQLKECLTGNDGANKTAVIRYCIYQAYRTHVLGLQYDRSFCYFMDLVYLFVVSRQQIHLDCCNNIYGITGIPGSIYVKTSFYFKKVSLLLLLMAFFFLL